MQMLRATRRYEVLQGTPGQPAVDLETVADGLQRISQLSTEYPAIQEVDLHPFVVGAVGVEPYVADAHMVLGAHPLTPVPA
jgi:acetyltransferase